MLCTKSTINKGHDSKCILVYDHIEKCAGTSIRTYLEKIFPNQKFLNHLPWRMSSETIRNVQCLAGQKIWGIHEIFPEYNFAYFTCLRSPENIAVSLYKFIVAKRGTLCTLEEFIIQEYPTNYLVRHLGNGSYVKALEKIEQYVSVCFVETLNDSLTQFTDLIRTTFSLTDLPQVPMPVVNVSKSKARFPEHLLPYFREKHQKDYELYEVAKKRHRPDVTVGASPQPAPSPTCAPEFTPSKVYRHTSQTSCRNTLRHILAANHDDPSLLDIDDFTLALTAAMDVDDPDIVYALFSQGNDLNRVIMTVDVLKYFLFGCNDFAQARECLKYIDSSFAATPDFECNALYEFRKNIEALSFYALNGEDKTRLHAHIATAIAAIKPEFLDREDYKTLTEIGINEGLCDALETFYRNILDYLNQPDHSYCGKADILVAIAQYLFNTKNYTLAKEGFTWVVRQDPLHFAALQALNVIARMTGGACDVGPDLKRLCDAVPGGKLEAVLKKELFLRDTAVNGLPALEQFSRTDYSEKVVNEKIAKDYVAVPFAQTNIEPRRILLIACCPDVVLQYFCRTCLVDATHQVDFLIKEAASSLVRSLPVTKQIFHFPSNKFSYIAEKHLLDEQFADSRYDFAFIVMSDYAIANYYDLIKYAYERTAGPIYMYFFDQILTSYQQHVFLHA